MTLIITERGAQWEMTWCLTRGQSLSQPSVCEQSLKIEGSQLAWCQSPSCAHKVYLVPMATFHRASAAGRPDCFGILYLWGTFPDSPPQTPLFLWDQCWQGGFLLPRSIEFFLVGCGVGRCVQGS